MAYYSVFLLVEKTLIYILYNTYVIPLRYYIPALIIK